MDDATAPQPQDQQDPPQPPSPSESVPGDTFDWNQVPSLPFIIYAMMLFIAGAIPNGKDLMGWDFSGQHCPGGYLWVILNMLALALPMLIVFGYVNRKSMNAIVHLTYYAGMTVAMIAVILLLLESYSNLFSTSTTLKIAIFTFFIVFYSPMYLLLSAMARRMVKLRTSHRIFEGFASLAVFLISGFEIFFVGAAIQTAAAHSERIMDFGILLFLLATCFAALLGFLNCTKYNDSALIVKLRLWGIAVALGSLIAFGMCAILMSSVKERANINDLINVLREFIFYVSVILLTAHAGSWILIRKVIIHQEKKPEGKVKRKSHKRK